MEAGREEAFPAAARLRTRLPDVAQGSLWEPGVCRARPLAAAPSTLRVLVSDGRSRQTVSPSLCPRGFRGAFQPSPDAAWVGGDVGYRQRGLDCGPPQCLAARGCCPVPGPLAGPWAAPALPRGPQGSGSHHRGFQPSWLPWLATREASLEEVCALLLFCFCYYLIFKLW